MSKKKQDVDPFAAREAEKYEFPIPSREFILEYLQELGRPVRMEWLQAHLQLTHEEEFEGLRRRLKAMVRDGQLLLNRKKEFALLDKVQLTHGRVFSQKDGSGVVISDTQEGRILLGKREMQKVFHGDRVLVRPAGFDKKGQPYGAVVEVLERNTLEIVGQFFMDEGVGFVRPSNEGIQQDILILPQHFAGATQGDIVTVELTSKSERRTHPLGKIIRCLGHKLSPGMEVEIAIRAHNLPHEWPPEVLAEAKKFKTRLSAADKENRKDLTDLSFVTIDGEDAQDYDDAVYCEKTSTGYSLFVAIADVTHYVLPGTALDKEAGDRGNSVYFPNRVIPMLPEVLSNKLCSLMPKVDRLAMVCEMSLTKTGDVKNFRFYKALIHSKARLTYTQVASMLVSQDAALRRQFQTVVPHLESLYELYQRLHKARSQRGAIDFDIPETKILFNDQGKIDKIISVQRNDAHRLIEECMLLANVCAAEFLLKHDMPGLFRIHEGPQQEKLQDLKTFLAEKALTLRGGTNPKPGDYAKLLKQIAGRVDAAMIQTVLLRSLSQAVYQGKNAGHFGLAYDAYTHFTSPIRRYPDLLVHRAIEHIIQRKRPSTFRYKEKEMNALGEHCSVTERRADEATRGAVAWLKCEYMSDKVGQQFEGVVTGVTSFGLFVALKDVYIEGLVHVTSLKNDYYRHDPVHHRLKGEVTGTYYTLGDPITVVVSRVNMEAKQLDFELVTSGSQAINKHKRGSKKATSRKHHDYHPKKTEKKSKSSTTKTAASKEKKPTKAKKGASTGKRK